ncbi:cell division protein FtsN [Xenorhabdus littoralis]|uniref:cell division protein FtsN n=1 Tax=Xenorhabdus littoralis TaxID=2582835 RepID=UPI0029E7FED4|nr:cell division protein FtsN [Xenorhabdus sp. psl]MDX7991964.1 cell division protein FtsN [Xenorhabdus sp. psl]
MAQRDYVSRGRSNPRRKNTGKSTGKKKNQAQGFPKTTLAVAVALVVIFIGGLYFIVHSKKESVQNAPQPTHQKKGHDLPPKPEERWSYIKELENRPVNESSIQDPTAILNQPLKPATQLTPEQQQLLEQMQADMRQQSPISLKEVPYNSDSVPRSRVVITPPAQQPFTQEQATQPQSGQYLPEQKPAVPQENKPSTSSPNSGEVSKPKPTVDKSKWMLQCGSFRAIEPAESVRASLAFAGIESQITTKDNWNRVILGPYKNKESAEKMRGRVAGAGVSDCILRPAGG